MFNFSTVCFRFKMQNPFGPRSASLLACPYKCMFHIRTDGPCQYPGESHNLKLNRKTLNRISNAGISTLADEIKQIYLDLSGQSLKTTVAYRSPNNSWHLNHPLLILQRHSLCANYTMHPVHKHCSMTATEEISTHKSMSRKLMNKCVCLMGLWHMWA